MHGPVRRGAAALLTTAIWLGVAAGAAQAGTITTVAGTPGSQGYTGDGGPATSAKLMSPLTVVNAPGGGFLTADIAANVVRRVAADGTISTFAGNGGLGFSGDGDSATGAQLNSPSNLGVGPDGSVFISDSGNNRIRRVAPNGIISTVAGTGAASFSGDGGQAAAAAINNPSGLFVRSDGTVVFADSGNSRIRQITPDGKISTIAGNGGGGYSGDGGQAIAAAIGTPSDVQRAADGGMLIADLTGHVVRHVAPDGTITTVAGTGASGDSGDGGPATSARLEAPQGVTPSADGGFYIVDQGTNRVRLVQADGLIRTVAGTGTAGFSGEGGPATSAMLNGPGETEIDAAGGLLIADTGNNVVRRVAGHFDDTAPPTSSADVNGAGCSTIAGLRIAVADAGSGATAVHVVADGGGEQVLAPDGGGVTVPLSEGSHQVDYWAQDAAGNVELTHHHVAVLVDSIAPSVSVTSDQGKTSYALGEPASVTIHASDANGLAADPSATGRALPTDTAGEHELAVTARDACENETVGRFGYTVTAPTALATRPGTGGGSGTTASSTPAKLIGGRPPRHCLSSRYLVIHIFPPRGVALRSVTVTLGGRRLPLLAGSPLRARIDLRKHRHGTYVVEVRAVTTTGRHLHDERVYHTCTSIKHKTKHHHLHR